MQRIIHTLVGQSSTAAPKEVIRRRLPSLQHYGCGLELGALPLELVAAPPEEQPETTSEHRQQRYLDGLALNQNFSLENFQNAREQLSTPDE